MLALFDAIAGRDAPGGDRTVTGIYRRRVPLATPLALTIDRGADTTHLRLSDTTATLVEGSVASGAWAEAAGGGPAPSLGAQKGEPLARLFCANRSGAAPPPAASAHAPLAPANDQTGLPLSKTCFACGTENTLGLRARLTIDDERVGGVWTPDETFRVEDSVAPIAVTTLLDEAAFWLGAAASGEAGMTTDLRVRLHSPAAFGPIVVAGSRATVRERPDDSRYWETEIAAWNASGTLVASAAITFVAVRGAARKLVTGLLAVNPPAVLRRVFPAYVR